MQRRQHKKREPTGLASALPKNITQSNRKGVVCLIG